MTRTTALVTGAGGHIGRALLSRLAASGDRVIGVDRPGTPRPDGVDRWIEVDLADTASEAALAGALAGLGRIDTVVAAAGVTALGRFDETDDATFRRVMDVNFHGAVRTVRVTLPALRASGGHLLAISSVAGLVPVPGRPAYVAAKHALTGTLLALADELGRDGVGVTVVHPTFLDTPVTEVGAGAARTTTGAPLTADDVARDLVGLVARRRAGRRVPQRVVIGTTGKVADLAARISPALARTLAARRVR